MISFENLMSYKSRTLFRLIEEINHSLFLPHIQRPFVWDEDQIQRLFDSLMRNYPIQTLLFWRTKNAIKARRFMRSVDWEADLHEYYDEAKSKEGVEKVFVLDGQQRLQTLYSIFNGTIKSEDGKTELGAYFDITSGGVAQNGELLYRLKLSVEKLTLPFYRLRNLLTLDCQKDHTTLADELNDELDSLLEEKRSEQRTRQRLVHRNIAQLRSILLDERHFWIQELDGVASKYPYKSILDIFVRVNSGGTKLDASDLMFAAMKEGWDEIEQKIENVTDMLNSSGLCFDKTFPLKCLVVAHDRGAELSVENFSGSAGKKLLKSIKADWARAELAFRGLHHFIAQYLKIYGDKVVRSYSSFVPLFDYIYHNPQPDEANQALMRGYYYKSQLFNWYSAQTDNIINAMHKRLGIALASGFPLEAIKQYFRDSRGADVELTAKHVQNHRRRFIILNLVYVDRLGSAFFSFFLRGNTPHVGYIYPPRLLKKLDLPKQEVNHIGNQYLVGARENLRKGEEPPDAFFQGLKARGIDASSHLLVPEYCDDPSMLTLEPQTYRNLRDRRLQAICQIADRVVNPELVSVAIGC